jgi:phospholipase D1/2
MASLAKVVLEAQKSAKSGEPPAKDVSDPVTTNGKDPTATPVNPANDPGLANPSINYHLKANSSSSKPRSRQSSYKQPPMPYLHSTPSERTGPPRSISFSSLPNSRVVSRSNSRTETGYPLTETPSAIAGPSTSPNYNHKLRPPQLLVRTETQFRDALEYDDPDQREREREYFERVERRKLRDSRFEDWNPIRWLTDSPRDTPKEEHPHFDLDVGSETEKEGNERRPKLTHPLSAQPDGPPPRRKRGTQRSNSLPAAPKRRDSKDKEKRTSGAGWGRVVRSLLPTVITQSHSQASQAGGSSALAQHSVNITDELITGGLSALMLKLWFERDEKGHRRVPILLHRLRIRVSDSLHPLDGSKSVFRIECEYANGAARWVIYRQLREFVSLHTHYTISNAYNRNVTALPEFPKTSE